MKTIIWISPLLTLLATTALVIATWIYASSSRKQSKVMEDQARATRELSDAIWKDLKFRTTPQLSIASHEFTRHRREGMRDDEINVVVRLDFHNYGLNAVLLHAIELYVWPRDDAEAMQHKRFVQEIAGTRVDTQPSPCLSKYLEWVVQPAETWRFWARVCCSAGGERIWVCQYPKPGIPELDKLFEEECKAC